MSAFDDGDFSEAQPDGPPRPVIPFSDNQIYIWEQDYQVNVADFEPLALGTAYPEDGNFFLVEETQPQPLGGGLVRWTRVFAKVPNQRNEFESFAYLFPGTFGGQELDIDNREAITRVVSTRLQFDYYQSSDPVTEIDIEEPFEVIGLATAVPGRAEPYWLTGLTNPTLEDYFNNLVGTEAVAENSYFRRWRGDIYERVTRYVVLQ